MRDYSWQSGELNCRAKLNEVKVKTIRERYATGEYSHQKLADIYGVNKKTIFKVLHHQTWKLGES